MSWRIGVRGVAGDESHERVASKRGVVIDGLHKLEQSLNATNVLSDDYGRHILAFAHTIAQQAYDNGRADERNHAVAKVAEYVRQRPACGTLAKYENALADEIERAFGVTS
jgi:hypothetical protein